MILKSNHWKNIFGFAKWHLSYLRLRRLSASLESFYFYLCEVIMVSFSTHTQFFASKGNSKNRSNTSTKAQRKKKKLFELFLVQFWQKKVAITRKLESEKSVYMFDLMLVNCCNYLMAFSVLLFHRKKCLHFRAQNRKKCWREISFKFFHLFFTERRHSTENFHITKHIQ